MLFFVLSAIIGVRSPNVYLLLVLFVVIIVNTYSKFYILFKVVRVIFLNKVVLNAVLKSLVELYYKWNVVLSL